MVASALLIAACSSERGQDAAAIVPEGLRVTALPGGNGVLEVIALTLRKGASNPELYAALQNRGDKPACAAAFSVELFDKTEQSVAAGISGLLTQHFYRRTDGSAAIAACVSPGDVTMAAVLDLPIDLAIEDVGHVVYRCPYFALDVTPIDGLEIRDISKVTNTRGTTYSGTLVNNLDVAVTNPSVSVFPVNRAQRPLGMVMSQGEVVIAPGGSWTFETDVIDTLGVDQRAYPAGAL